MEGHKGLLTGCLLLLYLAAASQGTSNACDSVFNRAQRYFRAGSYDTALRKLAAYKICDPGRTGRADGMILEIYDSIRQQRNNAVDARNEAIRQKDTADARALVILQKSDSIQRENLSNQLATQALQVNELDPLQAIGLAYRGLCLSPDNPSLTEIKKKILTDEVMRRSLPGASPFGTLCAAGMGDQVVTGDATGKIALWDPTDKKLVRVIAAFRSRIRGLVVTDSLGLVVALGNDSKAGGPVRFALKRVYVLTGRVAEIADDPAIAGGDEYSCLGVSRQAHSVYIGTKKGKILQYDYVTNRMATIGQDTVGIVGIQVVEGLGKLLYATTYAVKDLSGGKTLYQPPVDSYISLLDFCPSNGDLYIGMGADVVLYNFFTRKDHLMAPLHKAVVTSCHCADSTGSFLSTSLDNNAILWSPGGNFGQVLKGSRSELYDGYIPPDGSYAITVGNREMDAGVQADTGTLKFWYLKGFLKKELKEAHFMGVTAIRYDRVHHFFFSAGTDGWVNCWDSSLRPLSRIKADDAGVSALGLDAAARTIVYGSYSGMVGELTYSPDGLLSMIPGRSAVKRHAAAVKAVQVWRDRIYSAGKDGALYIGRLGGEALDSVYFDIALNSLSISGDGSRLLIGTAKGLYCYDWRKRAREVYRLPADVNGAEWISPTRFATVSGQYLRIWQLHRTNAPILIMDNNLRNLMMSVFVDTVNQLIYTGTWSGYIICWDYSGRQLFLLDQLTSLADTNIIQAISGNADNTIVVTGDYDGNITSWYSPGRFLEKELKIKIDCGAVKKLLNRSGK